MTNSFEVLPDYINEQASEWFSLVQSGNVTEEDQLRIDAWLSESLEHKKAYQQIESVWVVLAEQSSADEVMALRRSVQSNWILAKSKWIIYSLLAGFQNTINLLARKPANYALAVTFLLLVTGVALNEQPSSSAVNFYATKTGQIQTLILTDGSEITLGAKSKIKIKIDNSERAAELLYGEAFFDIASDKSRPFLVLADNVAIEVIGTQFNVLKRSKSINVSVLEGQVNVSNRVTQSSNKNMGNLVSLTAGQQVVKTNNSSFGQIASIDIAGLATWRSGRLIFTETTLGDVITDASRYYDGKFSMQSDELASKKVTLSLRTDQVDQLPQMLAQVLPIDYRQIPGNIIVLENSGAF